MDEEIMQYRIKESRRILAHDILYLFESGRLLVEQCNACCGGCSYENHDGNTVYCECCHGTGYRVKEGFGGVDTTKPEVRSQLQEDIHATR